MATCKACGEPIRWIKTRAGKAMPVDEDSFAQHQLAEGVTIVTDAGDVLRGATDGTEQVYGYVPHWQTCQHADLFRRAK